MGDRALEVPPSSGGVEDDRLRAEQVAALFRVSAMGVLGAVVGAAVLAGVLVYAQVLSPVRGAVWAGYIAACAVAHLILRHLFQRRARVGRGWRPWAAGFTVISLAEGIGWGWASVRLVGYGRFDAEMLVIDACLALAVGSIAAFSFYLPAFAAMFFPTTVPFTVWSLMSPHPLQQAGGALMIVFVPVMAGLGLAANRNFTELVGLRIQSQMLADGLRRQKELAEEANLAKSTFLAAASHDLRQPVHALGLFVGALRNVAMPPEGVHIVDQIEASVAATNGLFGALLDISRLDAGIVEVRPRAFAIQPLLDRLCGEHAAEAAAKGIDLRCVRCGLVAFADPVLIERILRNLISNATRYTDSGRIVVGCRRGASLRVEVWDTGPGIPADQQEKIFQEYHQLANPERDRAKGLGLGLAIVRRLSLRARPRLALQPRDPEGARCRRGPWPHRRAGGQAHDPERPDHGDRRRAGDPRGHGPALDGVGVRGPDGRLDRRGFRASGAPCGHTRPDRLRLPATRGRDRALRHPKPARALRRPHPRRPADRRHGPRPPARSQGQRLPAAAQACRSRAAARGARQPHRRRSRGGLGADLAAGRRHMSFFSRAASAAWVRLTTFRRVITAVT
jgi:signal transduction histidine kinase